MAKVIKSIVISRSLFDDKDKLVEKTHEVITFTDDVFSISDLYMEKTSFDTFIETLRKATSAGKVANG